MPYLLYPQEHEDAYNNDVHQEKRHLQQQFDRCFQCRNRHLRENHPATTVTQLLGITRYLTPLIQHVQGVAKK